ncbi:unnamed protein product [Rodentolepis nana]|uniref:PH domain-containing protein n=1 Tax=Rodentolepis nana TaxID=102285 RepID=A0A0R3T676_RODNA|nr:unnamed protein product [Rodentolepis nana]
MAELDAWLDDQEERLEQTTSITTTNTSIASVEKAMAHQVDIEKALEDARQRFEAIKRQTVVETLKFEMLKFMTKRGEASNAEDQPFSSARIAEIQRRETSKLNRNRSKRVTPTENAADQKAQENLRAIFGNLGTIEPITEPVQKLAVPTTLEIPPAVSHNDSFGMTNAQFVRPVSTSSDIDSPVNEMPQTSPKKRISFNLSSQGQKSNSKFMELFKRTSSPHPSDTRKSFSTLTVTSSGDAPTESPNRLSVGERAAKFFSKMRKHSGEVGGSQSSLVSLSIPETPSTPKAEQVRILPPLSPSSSSTASRYENRPTSLNTYLRDGNQSTKNTNFATRDRLPKSPDGWSPSGRASVNNNSFTLKSGSTSGVNKSNEESKNPTHMGSLARKIVTAPKSYHGVTKKWIPQTTRSVSSYGWAVLEGSRLNFYSNCGGNI